MASLLIKDAPAAVHQWIRNEAARNRRSMNAQIIFCLERLMAESTTELDQPFKLRGGVVPKWEDFNLARQEGRK